MDLPEISTAPIIVFVLMLTRILAMVMVLPVSPGAAAYDPVRIGIGLFTTLAAFAHHSAIPTGISEPVGMALALGGEVLLGVGIGMCVRITLEAVSIAGQMIGFQIGFTIANVVDPVTGDQDSILGAFQMLLATLLFVLTGLYNLFVEGVVHSFDLVPPGMVSPTGAGLYLFIDMAGRMFVNSLVIGAPWIFSLLLTKVGFGLVARTFPQMNVFFVGFPVTVALGFIVFSVGMPFFFAALTSILNETPEQFATLVRASMPGF